jgi:hypothetical protein
MNYARLFRLDEMVAVIRRFRGRGGRVTGTGLGAEVGLRSRSGQRSFGHGAWEARPDSTPHPTPLMAGLITVGPRGAVPP